MTAQEEAQSRELRIERRHIMEEYDLEAEELKTYLVKVRGSSCVRRCMCGMEAASRQLLTPHSEEKAFSHRIARPCVKHCLPSRERQAGATAGNPHCASVRLTART